ATAGWSAETTAGRAVPTAAGRSAVASALGAIAASAVTAGRCAVARSRRTKAGGRITARPIRWRLSAAHRAREAEIDGCKRDHHHRNRHECTAQAREVARDDEKKRDQAEEKYFPLLAVRRRPAGFHRVDGPHLLIDAVIRGERQAEPEDDARH